MAGYLLNWSLRGEFPWRQQPQEAALSQSGQNVCRRWSVGNTAGIRFGDRLFVKISRSRRNGLVGSGYAIDPPAGREPLQDTSVVYLDHPYVPNSHEELDRGQRKRYVMVRFDALLLPEFSLQTHELRGGSLETVAWTAPRSGIEIRPKKTQAFKGDVMPYLEKVWGNHLSSMKFLPVVLNEEEKEISALWGWEGRKRLRQHWIRERKPGLRDAKVVQSRQQDKPIACEVCGFVFGIGYKQHGEGFIEVHHREPLMTADVDNGREVGLDDLALVCANCHRMLHRGKPLPTIDQLRSIMGICWLTCSSDCSDLGKISYRAVPIG